MYIKDPILFRANVCHSLNAIIQNDKYSLNLEKGIFNYSIKEASSRKIIKKWDNINFVQIYVDQFRSIYFNIKNENILQKIKDKLIKPDVLAFMTHQEMNPDRWKILIEKKIKRDQSKYKTDMDAATDIFNCKKCKSNKCSYYQMQTRSADEPMTTFVSCLECGARWKC
jgi:transcription elongation factor S-II